MCLALTVVFFAASGFVLTNASTGTELRGDRVTSAVALAHRAMADPQAQALHVDSNTVRTVQAAAIRDVPDIIAFGAGLIWPRS
jgi:hypothetical protein